MKKLFCKRMFGNKFLGNVNTGMGYYGMKEGMAFAGGSDYSQKGKEDRG